MRLCVIGMGYVGLPTALMFAASGHDVSCVDIKDPLINSLRSGTFHSSEPGLDELYRHVWRTTSIEFSTTPTQSDGYVLALPTPLNVDHSADLSAIYHVATQIKSFVGSQTLIVLESTVPPGTTQQLMEWIGNADALYAHVPERVLPGNLLYELSHNDRIVGGLTAAATEAAVDLYQSFVLGRFRKTDAATAEMAKLMENTYRDINIALANQFSRVSHQLGISVRDAIAIANDHPRVNILQPGLGVGGHCIAIDPWFIVEKVPEEASFIAEARKINDSQPRFVVDCLTEIMGGSLNERKIAVLGLAFKGDVDDPRESPSISLLEHLSAAKSVVRVHDPLISHLQNWISESPEDILPWAEGIVVATGHSVYRWLIWKLRHLLNREVKIVDAPGILNAHEWHQEGIAVHVIGDGRRVVQIH